MKNLFKEKKAITLIALIITIVVLIILAGVLINISLGNNGLFNKAKTAKEMYTNAQTQEETEIAKMTNNIDGYVGGYRDYEAEISELKAEINKLKNANSYSTTEKVIGTWIDGKSLYKKTITGDSLPANGAILISNVDVVANAYGEQLFNNSIWYHYPYMSIIRWELYSADHTLRALIADSNNSTKYKWTFEYTKTTD